MPDPHRNFTDRPNDSVSDLSYAKKCDHVGNNHIRVLMTRYSIIVAN